MGRSPRRGYVQAMVDILTATGKRVSQLSNEWGNKYQCVLEKLALFQAASLVTIEGSRLIS